MTAPTILIAGGGTGGHVFPGVAVAEALRELGAGEAIFCGTDRGLESRVIPAYGWTLERLHVEPIRGGGVRRAARGGWIAARATARSFETLRRVRPSAVLSVGGYAAGPVSLAASVLRIPLAVLEPNSAVGLANRILGPLARRAYIAWDEAAASFRRATLRRFGVPLRKGFRPDPYVARRSRRVLVMGGSQGAAVFNERLPQAIARLGAGATEVLHQTGRDREGAVRAAYASAGVEHACVVPFIEDVASAIASADLVVARAGAGTIAEITAVGRAALLVPFPHAADDHQTKNAVALARRGGTAWLSQREADPARLAALLEHLLADDAGRTAMADVARANGRPDAARDVAADLLAVARGGT